MQFTPAIAMADAFKQVTRVVNKKVVTEKIKIKVPYDVPYHVTIANAAGKKVFDKTISHRNPVQECRYNFFPNANETLTITVQNVGVAKGGIAIAAN